ncbi:type II secretion system F family protein [Vibrio tapetis subsp. quintayensis]|uniref:type II secretion system F family protein n=1 Tax=Vibrio tapetis TaxID=52443 RepID=UPI0025B5AA96|nr:type II secretion system F family protein [Vibrio tapetis]MDN3681426.1 type II secretion system F family protein [Vibrio tapetis subsp. quintayensis]
MNSIIDMLARPDVQVTLLLWLFVILIATTVYFVVEYLRRKRKLRRFGLVTKETQKHIQLIDQTTEQFNEMFTSSSADMSEKFVAAGFYDTRYAALVTPFKYIFVVIGGLSIGYFGYISGWEFKNYVIAELVWLVLLIVLPDIYLAAKKKALQNKISSQLPYLLDLMGVCVQTGMTIEAAMAYLGKEMQGFDKDLAHVLKRTNDRARLVSLEVALQELYQRVPTSEVRSFVMTLNQSLQYGSSIYDVLVTLAVDIREVQMLGLEEKIGKLAAKMSLPLIIFIMFPIVILIAVPGVMRLMSGG